MDSERKIRLLGKEMTPTGLMLRGMLVMVLGIGVGQVYAPAAYVGFYGGLVMMGCAAYEGGKVAKNRENLS
ncbi:MAG TPA: hypothetical protein VMW95_07385 [Desulfobacterales bacterium]|nr:hypothetical protein [Desulfobacterales bacterium]HUW24681.1 hypothetical protein [Patescibacteria group bacterium]